MIFPDDFGNEDRVYTQHLADKVKQQFTEASCIEFAFTIVGGFDPEGKPIWFCNLSGEPNLSNVLGLMRMAEINLMVTTPGSTAISQ